MRLRIHFHKTEAMRFTGHLDLHKAWERTLRRAELRLAYSQGFHPQPRINLACALPLGFTSECELVDIWLEDEMPVDQIQIQLMPALPPGIMITHVEDIPLSAPSLQTQVVAVEYSITYLDPIPGKGPMPAELLSAETLPRERRGKAYDLRPLIEALEVRPPALDGCAHWFVRLAAREKATGRPEEVVAALGLDPSAARYHRTRLILLENQPSPAAS